MPQDGYTLIKSGLSRLSAAIASDTEAQAFTWATALASANESNSRVSASSSTISTCPPSSLGVETAKGSLSRGAGMVDPIALG